MIAGALSGTITISALELSKEIGALDAVVSIGFPDNIMHIGQQSGRVGRVRR
jgi:DEAD/DEAH box helicase domain-containing protein